jgi:hypothetical protein
MASKHSFTGPNFGADFPAVVSAEDAYQSDAVAYSRVCFIPPDGSFHFTETNFVNGSICHTAPRFQMNGVQRNNHSRTTSLSVSTAVSQLAHWPSGNAAITEPTGVVSKDVMRPAVRCVA